MSNSPIDRWKREIRSRKRADRRRRAELEECISRSVESIVETVRSADPKLRDQTSAQLGRLSDVAASDEADLGTLSYVERELRVLGQEVREAMDYEEAVEEADEVYGDQSENDTYYGLGRQGARKNPMKLDEAQMESDEVYGDQSDNETYYRLDEKSDRHSFEDDGEWIDEEDRLDL